MPETNPLTETLDLVEEESSGSRVYFGDVLKALNHRGFGPLMMLPALLALLPTGAIPGVPALCGASLCLISVQILSGRHYPWLPKRLQRLEIRRKKLTALIDKARPITRRIDNHVCPRLDILFHPVVHIVVALLCLMLGLLMIVAGFIPLLPMMLAIPVLLFALGATARDGVMTLAGFAFTFAAVVFILWMSGWGGGEDQLHITVPVFTIPSPT